MALLGGPAVPLRPGLRRLDVVDLVEAQRQERRRRPGDQLEESLHSRTVVDQAFGIIMRDHRCTATDTVTRTTGAPPEPGRAFVAS